MNTMSRRHVAALAAAAAAVALSLSLLAQSPEGQGQFEAVSIKQNTTGATAGGIMPMPGGRFHAVNVPARQLVQIAYRVPDQQLVGGPDWLRTDRFDVSAKAEGELNPDRTSMLLRRVLADRFKLSVRTETRELPVYALVLAKADGRLPPQVRPSTVNCTAGSRAQAPGLPPECGVRVRGGRLAATAQPIAALTAPLTRQLERPVVDRTGLSGVFDYELSWTPEAGPQLAADPGSLSVFTAIQEQLGLKLEATRGPVEIVVIERIERPTED